MTLNKKEALALKLLLDKQKQPVKQEKIEVEQHNRKILLDLHEKINQLMIGIFGIIIMVMVAYEKLRLLDQYIIYAIVGVCILGFIIACRNQYKLQKVRKDGLAQGT